MTDTWTAEVAALAHEKVGHTDQGLWHHKGMQLPAYIQHIANDLIQERGMDESRAIATAVSRCKEWCAGGGGVKPETKAKACAAVAEWEALRTSTHAEGPGEPVTVLLADWVEEKHPRGRGGRFAHVPGGGGGGGLPTSMEQHHRMTVALDKSTAQLRAAEKEGRLSADEAGTLKELHKLLGEQQAMLSHEMNAHINAEGAQAREEHRAKIIKIIGRILALISAAVMAWMSAHGVESGVLLEMVAAAAPIASEMGIEKVSRKVAK